MTHYNRVSGSEAFGAADYDKWKVNVYSKLMSLFGYDEQAWRNQYDLDPTMQIIWNEAEETPTPIPIFPDNPFAKQYTSKEIKHGSKNYKASPGNGARICRTTTEYLNMLSEFEKDTRFQKHILRRNDQGVTVFIADNNADLLYHYPYIWQVAITFNTGAFTRNTFNGVTSIFIYIDMLNGDTESLLSHFYLESNPNRLRILNQALYEAVKFNSGFTIDNVLNVSGNSLIADRYDIDIYLSGCMLNGATDKSGKRRCDFKTASEQEAALPSAMNNQLLRTWDRLLEICRDYTAASTAANKQEIMNRLDDDTAAVFDMYKEGGVKLKDANGNTVNGLIVNKLNKGNSFSASIPHDYTIVKNEIIPPIYVTRMDNESDASLADRFMEALSNNGLSLSDLSFVRRNPSDTDVEYIIKCNDALRSRYDSMEDTNPMTKELLFGDTMDIQYAWNAVFIFHYEVDGIKGCVEGFSSLLRKSSSVIECILIVVAVCFVILMFFFLYRRSRYSFKVVKVIAQPAQPTEESDVNYKPEETKT